MNSAQTNVDWNYNGSCVTSSSGHTTDYGWFELWSKVDSDTSSGRTCSGASTTSNSEFLNRAFCATIDTRTEYRPNQIVGQENGTYTMNWSADAWGGCADLLSFHRTHGYG